MSLGEMNCFEKVYVCMQIYKYNVYIKNICSLVKIIGVIEWDTKVIRTSIFIFVFVYEIFDKFIIGIFEFLFYIVEVFLD